MRRLRSEWLCLMVAVAGLALWQPLASAAPRAGSTGVRVIAVQPRVDLAYCDTYEHYRQHLMALVDAQVRPRLAAGRPNLVVFPEDVGLPAAFIGSRGAIARTQSTTLSGYGALFMGDPPPYGPAMYYYSLAMPGLPPQRLPNLALTDTLWRAFYETMRSIARQTGAWVVGCTNVSGQVVRLSSAEIPPEAFFLLSDPDIVSDYVYVALDPAVYNTTFVFAPTGDIVAAVRKPYLVDWEEGLLGFEYGSISASTPVDLGFARLGIFSSKPAWMPDVIDRMSILGADTFVQPEAFGGWTIPDDLTHLEDWLPDNFLQSGWAAVQKDSGFRYAIIPHLTGNLFELPFDGQTALIADATPGQVSWAYVGQPQQGGFLALAPWAAPDPGIADPSLPLDARRLMLRQTGISLLPGMPNNNGYVETAIWADIEPTAPFPVQPDGPRGSLGRSAPVAPSFRGEQTRASVASLGQTVAIVWQDTRHGVPQVYAAVSRNGGAGFPIVRRVSPSVNPQRTPAVTVSPAGIHVAWQEEVGGERRIMVASSIGPLAPFDPATTLPTASPADEWVPSLAWGWDRTWHRPRAAVYVAFVQTLAGNERVMVARRLAGTSTWQVRPADPDALPYTPPNPRNNQWAPAIAARGHDVAVAWVDFRSFSWDVKLAVSHDAGASFGAPIRVDDGPDAWERVNGEPSLAYGPDGTLVCGWTDVRQRHAKAQARAARIVGDHVSASVVLAASAGPDAATWRPAVATLGDGRMVSAWQDFRTLGNDIYLAVSRNGGASFGLERRVDDGGEGPSYQFAPRAIGLAGRRALVLWEDTRSGRSRIRYAVGVVDR